MWQVCWWRWLEPPLSSSSDSYGQFPSSPSPIVILCAMCLILLHEVPTMLLPYSPLLVVVFFPLVVVFVAPPSPPPYYYLHHHLGRCHFPSGPQLLISSPSAASWSLLLSSGWQCHPFIVVVVAVCWSSLRPLCCYQHPSSDPCHLVVVDEF